MNVLEKVGIVIVLVSQICIGARYYSEVTFEFPALPLTNPLLSSH